MKHEEVVGGEVLGGRTHEWTKMIRKGRKVNFR